MPAFAGASFRGWRAASIRMCAPDALRRYASEGADRAVACDTCGPDREAHRKTIHRALKSSEHSPGPRGLVPGAPAAPGRAGAKVPICVHVRARRAVHHGARRSPRPDSRMVGRARRRGLEFNAHPRMLRLACELCPRQQGARHAGPAGVPRTPQHPAHGALHRVVRDAVQELLALIRTSRPRRNVIHRRAERREHQRGRG